MFRILCICCLGVFSCFAAHTSRAVCVKDSAAELKVAPSDSAATIRTVIKNTPLKILRTSEKQRDWYKVANVDGERFWVKKDVVTKKYLCATVRVKTANLRRGPGTKHAKVYKKPVGKHSSFEVIGKQGVWLKLKEPFQQSVWVHRSLVWVQ